MHDAAASGMLPVAGGYLRPKEVGAAMIRVVELRKSFGTITAVDSVSFDIAPGETFGLLGPNGAGKSTTISMMVGALDPDSGEVVLDGNADPKRNGDRRLLGLAPQTISLYDELTAAENLYFFGRLYGLRGDELRGRVEWALEFARLGDRRRHRVKTFSGGMKRRLNLAAALVHEPLVILLDEPTAGVDPQSRNHIFDSIEALRDEGRTIVYTTHYMEEAQRLCDRVAIMDHGSVLALDTVDGLIDRYGGESVVYAELSRPPENEADLPAPLDGLALRFASERPLEAVGRLAGTPGVNLATLRVDRPDLESVFLSLTGRSLRD
ncbi:MAG: ABC transporter ATP-binding protein [Phycisphaerales bacterium]